MPLRFGVCLISIGLVMWSDGVWAFERTALALTGSRCRESQTAIIEALKHLDGVARVETGLIPDHVLVDHDGRGPKDEELAAAINALGGPEGHCQAVLMRSCITAPPSAGTPFSSRSR